MLDGWSANFDPLIICLEVLEISEDSLWQVATIYMLGQLKSYAYIIDIPVYYQSTDSLQDEG